jgi:hypothetical protein
MFILYSWVQLPAQEYTIPAHCPSGEQSHCGPSLMPLVPENSQGLSGVLIRIGCPVQAVGLAISIMKISCLLSFGVWPRGHPEYTKHWLPCREMTVPSMAHCSSGIPSRRPWKDHVEESRGEDSVEGPVRTNMRWVLFPWAGSAAAKYTYQRPWREWSSGAQRSLEYGVFGGGRLRSPSLSGEEQPIRFQV